MGYYDDAKKRLSQRPANEERYGSRYSDAKERLKKREEEEKRALVQSDPAGLRELTSYDTFQKQRQLAEAKNNTAIQRQEEAQKQNAEKAYLDNKARLDELNQLKKDTMSATLTASQTRNPNLVNKTLADAGFASMRDLTDEISKRTQEYNLATAQREKDEAKASALSSPDFAQYSEMGKSFGNNVSTERNGTFNIGNKVTFSKENPEMLQRMKASGINLGDERYSNMTDEEVNIYSYYLAKEKAGLLPEGTADNYLYTIDADLNARQGAQIAEKHEDSLATELLFGISAGLDQHYSGLANLGNALGLNNKPQTPSAIALASQQIRDSLSEKSKVAQFAYDAVTTTSNMLPSMLTSVLLTKGLGVAEGVARTVGAVSMGTSASGNAYNEMKNLGYDDGSARTYALITGLSETLLQEALGGIPGVGSVLTDKGVEKFASGLNNAAAKFALRMGANAYAEGMEEFLQDVLNPYFKAFATGEHAEDIDWEEAIYSGLLGAASSILMGGPAYISNAIETQRTFGPEQQAIIDEGLASEEGTQSRAIAEAYQKKVESGKNLNALELQNLYEANIEAINAENAKTTAENAEYVKKYFANLNYNEDVAKGMAEAYDSVTSDSVTEYSNAMETAFNYGKVGMSADTLSKANLPLTDAQKKIAYNLGSMERIKADAEASAKVVKADVSKLRKGAEVYLHGIDESTFNERQKASFDAVKNVVSNITNLPIHFYESEVNENGERVYKSNIPGTEVIKGQNAPNGFYDRPSDAIYLDINAGNNGEGTILWTLAHELTHSISYKNRDNFRKLASAVFDALGNAGADIEKLAYNQMAKSERAGHSIDFDTAIEEVVSDAMSEVFTRDGGIETFAQNIKKADKTLWQKIKEFFKGLAARISKAYGGLDAQTKEAEYMRKVTEGIDKINRLFAEGLVEVGQNEVVSENAVENNAVAAALKANDALFQLRYTEQHLKDLDAKVYGKNLGKFDRDTLVKRYTKAIKIWKSIGGELHSSFLDAWNNQDTKSRAFTVFKEQTGYKYNEELSTMCKKGVPLFEAIDTIVKEEVMKQLNTDVIGKEEKEILYDILKSKGFDIPCAICYVEQARQREGEIIKKFLDGDKGIGKIGWNEALDEIEADMRKQGVEFSFAKVSRSIATDSYTPSGTEMDAKTANAFYSALTRATNKAIRAYNESLSESDRKKKGRPEILQISPSSVEKALKGNINANLKIFRTLYKEPASRVRIDSDLLYSSMTAKNLTKDHRQLYSLFNQQGGVGGYKTKQTPVAYSGDYLSRKWTPESTRDNGGVRNQSNSDFQMYTFIDKVQEYVDLTAKGYTQHAYTKVLSMLKLFGLSNAKINASLIPLVHVYYNADGSVNVEKTQKYAGLDEHMNPIYDNIEGINAEEAFMILADPEYSKSIAGICIGYSHEHIKKLLDDARVQLIIGFHDKTDNPDKRYKGAKYAHNYNGENEATYIDNNGETKTVHIGFSEFLLKAEKMFSKVKGEFSGTADFNGETYDVDDIPKLAAKLYFEYCSNNNYMPAYNIEGIVDHENYYKVLADFGLYDSKGHYAPMKAVEFRLPESVPYLDNGVKKYMPVSDYIKKELASELQTRDDIAEALADKSEDGIIPQFIKEVNSKNNGRVYSDRDSVSAFAKGAEDFYGTTRKWELGGYLTVNGKMLDFSAGQGQRVIDHREIADYYFENGFELSNDVQGSGLMNEGMIRFMNDGNIRFQPFSGFEIVQLPTSEQFSTLRDIIEGYFYGNLSIDYSDESGKYLGTSNYVEDTPASRIIADIRERFRSGNIPKGTEDSTNGNIRYSDRVSQGITSADTSIPQVPALFNNSRVKFGKTNIDIGGGKYDLATEALAKRGTTNYIFDPFNRDAKFNRKALDVVMNGGADTATNANVLNVIAEPSARDNVILEVAKSIKPDGKAYFMVYEGNASGVGKETSKGWQNNRKTESYVPEIQKYFDKVTRNGKLITAEKPKSNLPKAYWELEAGGEVVRYSDRDSGGNKLTQAQMDYFKDSKVRDAEGNLKVMYHGSRAAGFTIFQRMYSDDNRSFFFTDKKSVAYGYNSTNEEFIPDRKYSYDELDAMISGYTNGDRYLEKDGDKIILNYYDDETYEGKQKVYDSLEDVRDDFIEYINRFRAMSDSATYKVYLNAKNPLVIECDNNNWDEITPPNYAHEYREVSIVKNDSTYEVDYADPNYNYHHEVLSKSEFDKKFGFEDYIYRSNEPEEYFEFLYTDKNGKVLPTTTRDFSAYGQKKGYDSVIFNNIIDTGLYAVNSRESSQVVVVFDSNQIKSVANENPTTNEDIRYQERDTTDAIDSRTILANALESATVSTEEYAELENYKKMTSYLNEKQNQLSAIREKIRQMSFGKGPRDTEKLNALRESAQKIAKEIDKYDRKLINIENGQPLRDLIERQRGEVEKRTRERARETANRFKERGNNAVKAKKIEELSLDIQKRIMNRKAKTSVPEIIGKTAADFLSHLDFTTFDVNGVARSGKANETRAELRESVTRLKENLEKHNATVEGSIGQLDVSPDLIEWLKKLTTTLDAFYGGMDRVLPVRLLKSEELDNLYKIVRTLHTTIVNAGKLYTQMSRNVDDVGRGTIEYLAPLSGGETDKRLDIVRRTLAWDYAQPITVFDRFGESGRELMNGLMKGQRTEADNVAKIVAFAEDAYTEEEVNKWREELHEVTIRGKKYNISTAMIMELHGLMKDKDARRHIVEGGGIRFDDLEIKNKVTRFTDTFISEEEAQRMLDLLTKRQIEVADNLQEFMDRVGAEWGNEVSMTRFGYHAFGQIANYYPIRTIKANSEYEARQKRANIYALLNKSFTKERENNAKNTIIVGDIFQTFNDHMSEMALYNAWALPVVDTIKWMNYKEGMDLEYQTNEVSVKESMRQAYGSYADEYIRRLLESINAQKPGTLSEELAFRGLRLVNRVAVAGNIRVAIQQPFSIVRATELINPKYIRPLVGEERRAAYNEMLEHSSFGKWKDMGYYDVDVSRPLESKVLKNDKLADKVTEKTMVMAEDGDAFTWAVLWNACKREVMLNNPGLATEEVIKRTSEKFDNIILRTQVVDSVLTKSQWMRSGNFWHRMTSAFMSEPMTSYNTLLRQYDNWYRDSKAMGKEAAFRKHMKPIRNVVGVFILTQLFNALATAPIDALRDDDDYKTFLEKMLEAFKDNAQQNLIPTSMMPFISDIVEYAIYGRTDRPDLQIWTKAIDLGKQFLKIFEEYDYIKLHKLFNSALSMTSSLTGLPMSNMLRDVLSIWNTIVGSVGMDHLKFRTTEAKNTAGYEKLFKSVETGKNLRESINALKEKDVDASTISSQITRHFKPEYKKMSNAQRADIKGYLLNAYAMLGYDRSEMSKKIDSWLTED